MSKHFEGAQKSEELRRCAERELAAQSHTPAAAAATDQQRLLHELQVHQIELEMQNETLRHAQTLLETSRDEYRNRFTDLYDFAPVGYLSVNSGNLITEVNLTAASMLGIERNRLILQRFHQWIAEESQDSWKRHCQQLKQQGGNQRCELLMLRRDGTTFDAQVDCCASAAGNEQASSVHITFSDITERKYNERQLLKSRQRFAEIIGSAMDGVISIDADQRILIFNAAAEKMFGCRADEAIGHSLERFIPERFRHAHGFHTRAFGRTAISSRRMGFMGHIMALRANGEEFPAEVSISQAGNDGEKMFTAILRDITERKQMEAQLQDSQRENQFLAELIRASTQPMGVGYPDGRMGLVNVAFEALTGYSAEELLSMDWATELTPPEWFEFEQSKLAELQRTGQSIRYEKEYLRKDGVRLPVELLVNLKTGADGLPEFYYAFVTDITERKHAERRIRESEQRMLLATEATGVGIWEWNVLTNTIHWDAQMFRIYGVAPTRSGFVNYQVWSGSVLPEDLLRQEEIMQDTIRRLGRSSRQFRIRRADDGKCRHIQAVEIVRTNAQGQVEWLVGTNLDITERVQADEFLKKSRAQLISFINHAPISMAMFDRDMNYLATSGRWLVDYGRGYTHLVGCNHYQLHPDLPNKWLDIHQQGLAGATLKNDEDLWIHADGNKQWVRWAVLPWRDENNGIGGIIISSEDITDRKINEAQLIEQAQQLRESDRRKDEFLAMLAHELRNPLAPIRNAVEILKLTNDDPSRIAWCADIMNRQLEHLTGLVDDLLDVSRIKRGLVVLKKELLEIRDFIQPAVETNQPMIEQRRQTLDITLPPEPIWVEGDRIRLAQVVANLINNAAKYTQEGGRIQLAVGPAEDKVCIRVSDNGCGLDPENLAHLFDLFYQAGRNLEISQGGLGIGLSIVHSLIAQHGGDVQASSAGLGLGSDFVIRLPRLIIPKPTKACTPAFTPPAQKKFRILLVDDNRDVAESLSMLLEMEGHQVQIAGDGCAALEIARTERPDVIFLDIGLPGLSGHAVAQELRRNSGLGQTLLIALTGYGQPEDRKKSLAAGFNEHLVKPLDPKKLRNLLNEYQAGSHAENPTQ